MTLESTVCRNRYIGNGVTTAFPFSFRAWKKEQVRVLVGDGRTESDVSAGTEIALSETGGTVVFSAAPAEGQVVVIKRSMPFVQEDRYLNSTRFDAAEVEDRFDQDCAERQQLRDAVSRCISLPETSETSGAELVADLLQARADVEQALEEAGAVTGATLVTATGSSEARAVQDHFSDIISVKQFGAAGDGLADDTASIQAALDAAEGGAVYFPKGVYNVSSTLIVRHTRVMLGESMIAWTAADAGHDFSSYMSDDLGDVYNAAIGSYGGIWYGAVVMDVRQPSGANYGARAVIEGGVIDGGMVADCCIRIHSFHALVHGVRIQNAYKCGIAVTPRTVDGSLFSGQVMISDCTLAQYGDNRRSANTTTIGLFIQDLDNHVDNCNVCWFGQGIVLRGSGNVISNTHITEAPHWDSSGYILSEENGSRLTYTPEMSNVVVHPCTNSVSGLNLLNNMYFNYGKYVVYYKKAYSTDIGRMAITISNSAYFLKTSLKDTSGKTETFLFGGECNCPLHVESFNAFAPSTVVFRGYFPVVDIGDGVITQNKININRTSRPTGIELISANNLANKPADTFTLCNSTYSIASGRYSRIGCILARIRSSNTIRADEIKLLCANRGYAHKNIVIYYDNATGKWVVDTTVSSHGSFGSITLFINNTPSTITINSKTYYYYNMYFGSPSNNVNDAITLEVGYSGGNFDVYMYSEPTCDGTDYITSLPSNYTTIV